MEHLKLILLVFALVLGVLATGYPVEPWPYRLRLLAAAFAFFIASIIFG